MKEILKRIRAWVLIQVCRVFGHSELRVRETEDIRWPRQTVWITKTCPRCGTVVSSDYIVRKHKFGPPKAWGLPKK